MADYYEPFRAQKSTTWKCDFRFEPEFPDEEKKREWFAAKAKAERNAPWYIMGTGMWKPGTAYELESGKEVPIDSTGTIAEVRRFETERGKLDAEAFARRIAACINFCAAVDLNSIGFRDLRAVLAELKALSEGPSREAVNDWFRQPKSENGPEVFPEMGAPQGNKVRKPRHEKRRY